MGVMQVATMPLIMVTSPTSEYKSVKDLIGTAKAKPGGLNDRSDRGLPRPTPSSAAMSAMGFTLFNAGSDLIQRGKIRPLRFEYDSWFGIQDHQAGHLIALRPI
jgi:hypothetical protein